MVWPEPAEQLTNADAPYTSKAIPKRMALELARIGRLGVGLSRVVFDLLERQGFEFGGELA